VTTGWYLPLLAFVILAVLECGSARRVPAGSLADHLLNLAGLAVQGIAIPAAGYLIAPAAGYLIATRVLAAHSPD